MENFEFVSPTHFVFGKGAEEQVGSKLAERGARTVLLHFGGQSAVKSGLIDRVKASLDAQGIKHVELGGVRPNPEITLAREGIALCKEHDVDWVLAVGGGSVIDSAKAIAVGAHYDGDVWDFFETKRLTDDVLPIAVVLTIPAAGSEASKNTVVSNDALQMKSGYANNAQRPKLAFMNPELTFTLPRSKQLRALPTCSAICWSASSTTWARCGDGQPVPVAYEDGAAPRRRASWWILRTTMRART